MTTRARFTLGCAAAILPTLGMAWLAETSGLDLWLQDRFYDSSQGQWLIDARSCFTRILFYTGPKVLLVMLAGLLITLAAGPQSWRRWAHDRGWIASRRSLFCVLACAAGVPISVSVLKNSSGVFCPSELERYGGSAPYRAPFAMSIAGDPDGRCWPAGHASGGFALLALVPAARRGRRARHIVYAGLSAGWIMGTYQMFKGAHFLSHNLVTLAIALCFAAIGGALLEKYFEKDAVAADAPPARARTTTALTVP